ncbi:hypothetical protein P153DRAFT_401642 [Dothidotthia symphoricarpi CBS 119687]|uniref:Uncharacterized protein n=1 Tax=Dothidotthia symphoricarpi CBS 119687 TaxID=1392245 RepID=A0A6A5ZVW4_9PLEO|nr:uncharacterized protein P153DRAFT_401642 [Dothidotthia symphoricarpi CBS 119687]KAF2123730.1 hypothetical protein P153DRAFT_401642 [Dothidotthia symphoricarpi CBS 119687]
MPRSCHKQHAQLTQLPSHGINSTRRYSSPPSFATSRRVTTLIQRKFVAVKKRCSVSVLIRTFGYNTAVSAMAFLMPSRVRGVHTCFVESHDDAARRHGSHMTRSCSSSHTASLGLEPDAQFRARRLRDLGSRLGGHIFRPQTRKPRRPTMHIHVARSSPSCIIGCTSSHLKQNHNATAMKCKGQDTCDAKDAIQDQEPSGCVGRMDSNLVPPFQFLLAHLITNNDSDTMRKRRDIHNQGNGATIDGHYEFELTAANKKGAEARGSQGRDHRAQLERHGYRFLQLDGDRSLGL